MGELDFWRGAVLAQVDAAMGFGLGGWSPLCWCMGEEGVALGMLEAQSFHGYIGRVGLKALSFG